MNDSLQVSEVIDILLPIRTVVKEIIFLTGHLGIQNTVTIILTLTDHL